MRRPALVLVMVAALGASAAVPAQAGKVLSFKNARAETAAIAAADCERDPECDEAEVGSCRRQAIRRIRCAAVTRDLDSDAPEQCTTLVLVRLRIDGRAVAEPGEPACTAILPPA